MSLEEAGLHLQDIELGSLDGESDHGLVDYFVTTPYVESVLALRSGHVLGRKGSGKSSLFTQLPRLLSDAGISIPLARVTPDHYAWSALRDYTEQGLTREQAHTNAWKFTLAMEIASVLVGIEGDRLGKAANASKTVLARFISSNYGDQEANISATAARLVKGLSSFNLEAFGFGVGFERQIAEKQALTPAVIDALLGHILEIVRETGAVVALDRLDDSWDGSEESRFLLTGLLKAAKELTDRLGGHRDKNGLCVIVLLRTDIYDGIRFDDKDKHRVLEQHIEWSPEQLKQMIAERLPEGIDVEDLFEEGDMRGSISPFNYLVKRTFLRPREVLQFMFECIRRAGGAARFISKDHIREAEERYSLWKVEDIKQEYSRVNPSFEACVEALRQGYNRYESIEDFQSHLESRIPAIVSEFGVRRIIEWLFESSAVGVRLGDAGSPRFKCEDGDLVLPASGAVYVHQGLHKGLNIRERRAAN
jgi:hypothetical protein